MAANSQAVQELGGILVLFSVTGDCAAVRRVVAQPARLRLGLERGFLFRRQTSLCSPFPLPTCRKPIRRSGRGSFAPGLTVMTLRYRSSPTRL